MGAQEQRSGGLSSAMSLSLECALVWVFKLLFCLWKPQLLAGSYQIDSLLTILMQSLCQVCVCDLSMVWFMAPNNSSLQQFQNEERKCSFWQGFCIRSKYSIIAFLKMRLYNVCVQRRCHMLAFHDVETKAHWSRHAYWLLSTSSQKGANGACRFQLSLGSMVLESVCVSMVWAFITSGSKRDLNMYLIKIQVAQMKAAWMNYS